MKKIYIAITIIIGIILICLSATSKQVYDGDELYSYTLSNSNTSGLMINNIKMDEWNDSKDIEKVFQLNNSEVFNLISIYKNQASDVHPPFYYLLFHIVEIFFLNSFSIVPGIILNIIAYIIGVIYLYKT